MIAIVDVVPIHCVSIPFSEGEKRETCGSTSISVFSKGGGVGILANLLACDRGTILALPKSSMISTNSSPFSFSQLLIHFVQTGEDIHS